MNLKDMAMNPRLTSRYKLMESISLTRSPIFLLIAVAFLHSHCTGAPNDSPSPRQGATLLKTDIMGVFAHPDDETGMAA